MRTRPGTIVGLLLIALVALSGCEISGKWNMLKSRRAFKQANVAYAAKEYESAIEFYNQTLDLDKNPDPRVLVTSVFYRGSSHHLIYRPYGAEDEAVNDAHLAAAIEDYGIAQGLASDHASEFEMLAPYQKYSMEQLAAIYRDNLQEFESAEKYFKALIELDQETPERYYALADVYERFHDAEEMPLIEEAIESYKKPVEMRPDEPVSYRQVASFLNKYGRFDETMEWLGKARDLQASSPDGYYLIAVHYWDKVYRDPDLGPQEIKDYIELGLDQLDLALEINDEYVDALIYKNLLLREQAKIEPRREEELLTLANELRDRAIVLQEQQEEAAEEEAIAAEETSQAAQGH
jgi:tetratricopeptide (TPR) repeat protein